MLFELLAKCNDELEVAMAEFGRLSCRMTQDAGPAGEALTIALFAQHVLAKLE